MVFWGCVLNVQDLVVVSVGYILGYLYIIGYVDSRLSQLLALLIVGYLECRTY